MHDWLEVTTAGDLLVRGARQWPESDAVVFPGARRTYADLLAGAEQAARSLLALGIRPRDRVGILMPNCVDFAEVFFGCQLIGAVAVPINARFKVRELCYVVENADLVSLLTTDLISEFAPFVKLLDEAFAGGRPPLLRTLVMLGASSPPGFINRRTFEISAEDVPAGEVKRLRESVRIRDVALMMFTSGTTANPKGCPLTHEALIRTAIAVADRFRLSDDDRFWDPLPMFHMGAILPLAAVFYAGGSFLSMTHFETRAALRQMVEERCTFSYPTFPTITQSLINHPDFNVADLSRVRAVLDTAPPETLRNVQAAFPQAVVITSYGLTEAGGVVAFGHLDDPLDKRMTTSGRPFRGMEVRVVDLETGAQLSPNQQGELCVRGPGLFEGYHKDKAKTAEVVDAQGWIHTGDLGTVDEDGRITYRGRSKDMLKVGGENVGALEIEAYLQLHPAVKIAQVVGVPDSRLIEVPAAFVELIEDCSATEQELIEFCRGRIASFKVPRFVRFTTEWPMSATKIQKFRLRERLLNELALEA
jgi:acyl-CoA synthetase (AMP-forming)/AMP-acid ligase II